MDGKGPFMRPHDEMIGVVKLEHEWLIRRERYGVRTNYKVSFVSNNGSFSMLFTFSSILASLVPVAGGLHSGRYRYPKKTLRLDIN